MRSLLFFSKPVPLFFVCAVLAWVVYFAGSYELDFFRRIMETVTQALRFEVIAVLIAVSIILQVPVYLGYQMVRNKSFDLRAQANASKAQKDRLTKQANSLTKDAGRLILISHRFQIVICVGFVLLVLPSLWDAVFADKRMIGVQWRYSLIVGAALFTLANFAFALAQFSNIISVRAKTVK